MITTRIIISYTINLILMLLVLFESHPLCGQVYGCRDPLANNYNPSATINNGSCTYNSTSYTPIIKVDPLSDTLIESSGLQMAGNFLWSFNDGGGAAAIYRMDTITNMLLQKVSLSGAENIDWEDIAFDGIYFYIGDFGNNANGARTNLKIYKFPLSAIPDYISNPVVTIPAGQINIINFSYSDQQQPPLPTINNNTKFDCEAMIVDGGKIHLFTKNWIDITTTHYEINGLAPGNYIAYPLETLITNYLVTAADKSIGKKMVALLGYKNTFPGLHYMHLLTDYNGGNYFNGNKRQFDLPNVLIVGQAEGICFKTATYGYISSDYFVPLSIKPKLHAFDVSNFVSNLAATYNFIGNGNWNDPNNWVNNIVPPATIEPGSEIMIDPAPGGQCVLNISYTVSAGAKLTVNTTKNFVIQGNLILQ
ncbi:MAG: hypothetical protein H7Z13_03270 [Ferruginibacter sp.]|nr:hypothetical protein [Ferruginibacter sp.]